MNLVYLGKIVNTHGLNGEIRIISDFEYKDKVFTAGNKIYVNNLEYTIISHRHHKIFDMVKLKEVIDIDCAIKLKGYKIFFNRDDFDFKILDDDIIGLDVYDNNIYKGKIIYILKNNKYKILVIDGIKKHMVPYIDEFVEYIDINNKKVFVKYIKGLDYED